MNFLHAIILGVIQGVGEFLPISSSGHLVLLPYIFGWDYQGLNFDVALHFGTVLALIVYFWHDWLAIIGNALQDTRNKIQDTNKSQILNSKFQTSNLTIEQSSNYPTNLFWIIMVASIPAAIAGYFLKDLAEHALRNPLLVAIFLAFFGLLLWLADVAYNSKKKISDLGYGKGFIVGIAQAIALFPGVSRSGITTTAGLFFSQDRRSATRFSFLLAAPVMIGAFLFALTDFQDSTANFPFFVAIFTSAVSGYISIKFLLRFLEKHGFAGFAIYRLALAIIIVILYFVR